MTVALVACLAGCTADDDGDSASSALRDRAATNDAREDGDERTGRGQSAEAPEDRKRLPNALGAIGTGDVALGGFGQEPTEVQTQAIAAVLRRYATAAGGDEAQLCEITAMATKRRLAKFADTADLSCAQLPGLLFSTYTPAMRRNLAQARLTKARIKGNHAIAVYTVPGPRWNMLPLELEDGTWKLSTYGKWSTID